MSLPTFTEIIDISLPLNEQTVVYPSNPTIEIETLKSASGTSVISKITMGSHTGTHVDAPSHVIEGGKTLDSLALEEFIGICRVIDCTHEKDAVTLNSLINLEIKAGERILFKTKNSLKGFESFHNDFIYVSSEAAKYLAEKKIKLVGIDYLSIKQKGFLDNRPHTEFLSKGIPIIEGVDLSKVDEGEYFLVAVPLRFIGIDGSPIRALLLR